MLKPVHAALLRIDVLIARIEGTALVVFLAVMLLVAFIQVFMRNFMSGALSWGDGLTRALVLWSGFMGASLAVKDGRYINVDAFSRLLGEKSKRMVKSLIYVFSSVTCFLLGIAGVSFVQMEKLAATKYSIGIESWIIELVIPVTFFFLALRFLVKLLGALIGEPLEKQEWEK
ncbi:MAG: hypothetical protein A2583_14585 [Bdellovibrionales bacterium RIFOXYD1_FULL_53_11]|nr:MAG: hypothetical protein A2583_14585 [Bdellovibrionales bacterium RIFOXYD1_FULL_53_11]